MSLLAAAVLGVLRDSPSSCGALQQLVEQVRYPQILQDFLPLEERIDALLLLHLCLLLLLLSDFCGLG